MGEAAKAAKRAGVEAAVEQAKAAKRAEVESAVEAAKAAKRAGVEAAVEQARADQNAKAEAETAAKAAQEVEAAPSAVDSKEASASESACVSLIQSASQGFQERQPQHTPKLASPPNAVRKLGLSPMTPACPDRLESPGWATPAVQIKQAGPVVVVSGLEVVEEGAKLSVQVSLGVN